MTPLKIEPDQRTIYKKNDILKAFIYLLVRDHVPFGIIEEIFWDLKETELKDYQFTNKIMEDYAQQAVNRLIKL